VQIFAGKITPNPPQTKYRYNSAIDKNTMNLCRYLLEKLLQILFKLDEQILAAC
jgi:hypothetical protein